MRRTFPSGDTKDWGRREAEEGDGRWEMGDGRFLAEGGSDITKRPAEATNRLSSASTGDCTEVMKAPRARGRTAAKGGRW